LFTFPIPFSGRGAIWSDDMKLFFLSSKNIILWVFASVILFANVCYAAGDNTKGSPGMDSFADCRLFLPEGPYTFDSDGKVQVSGYADLWDSVTNKLKFTFGNKLSYYKDDSHQKEFPHQVQFFLRNVPTILDT
jgi:hypothetical protein